MKSNNRLKEVDIKNRLCYYFDDIIKIEDFDFVNILIGEKSYKNILIFEISYETLISPKKLPIRFDKVDKFIRIF